ncbi:FUSC family protein [Methylovirgula sp. 4M-Z18]|uniref:FUSC family protein n=1 Tax=Methylovirgula sp. 4M-Z18 TaxID=2293567 RepID=UPI001314A9C1|nr:FUSC family protein [Methylovirgula sp. 4M-Z18]
MISLTANRIAKLKAVGIPLLYGLRLWLSIVLALYVAFRLELDEPGWAATTAAVVCLPQVGSSLRKAWFRILGTLVGAVVSLLLAAWFPQSRFLFLTSIAVWAGASAFAATLLRNFAAYGAALSGYTVAIVAGGALGAVGGLNADAVFDLAIGRASEIGIGIACAGSIRAVTDIGDAPRKLAAASARLYADIMRGFADTLAHAGEDPIDTRPVRRELLKRVIALDPLIDQTIGESSQIRAHSPVMQRAVDGLFAALVGWTAVGNHLGRLLRGEDRQQVEIVLQCIPSELRAVVERSDGTSWAANPRDLRHLCEAGVQRLNGLTADTPSLRLLADKTAVALAGMVHALEGLALVAHGQRPRSLRGTMYLRVPDLLPALVNAARAFVTIAALALFWVITGWPGGVGAIVLAMVLVILLAPRADQAYATARAFATGVVMDVPLTAFIHFVVLPSVPANFIAFSLVLGACLVPLGALTLWAGKPWQTGMFNAMTMLFVSMLGPTNLMSYNDLGFYNSSLATVTGCLAACASFRLIPPLLPSFRARRLLRLTLKDLRRLAKGRIHRDWNGHVFGRLAVLPAEASPLQRAQMLAAFSVGREIIQLRCLAIWLGLDADLERALTPVSQGHSVRAISELARFDSVLTAKGEAGMATQTVLRARGSIIVLSEALALHGAYFDTGARA